MDKTFTIYRVENIKNGKCYVGRTSKTPERRFKEHLRHALRKGSPYKFHAAIRKHGKGSFSLSVIESDVHSNQINEREAYWITQYDAFNRGYNMNPGGSGLVYYTDEQKKKMSRSQKLSYQNPSRGKGGAVGPCSEETKEKLRERALKRYSDPTNHPRFGAIVSEETRKKISDANRGKKSAFKGKTHSLETINKMSAAKRGVKREGSKKTYIFISPEGQIVNVHGLTDWCKNMNLNSGNMSSLYSGKIKSYKGWTKYKN